MLSDLSAAYLARAEGADSVDVLAALNAAQHAWELTRTPENAWNRALALSTANVHGLAIDAWQDYLAIDPASEWSSEARQRMNAIVGERPASRSSVELVLQRAVDDGNDAVLRATTAGIGIARSLAEDEWLPAWAAGDTKALAKTRTVASAIAALSADYVLTDSLAGIGRLDADATTSARDAFANFGKARRAMKNYRYDEALPLLESAAAEMERLHIPLAMRAKVYIATIHFYAKDAAHARTICTAILRSTDPQRFPSVVAQCEWNEGMIATGERQFDRARDAFQSASRRFEQMQDIRAVASLALRLEENARWTGELAAAWSHMTRALQQGVAVERAYLPFSEMARIADSAGMPFAALSMYQAAIDAALAANETTDAHLARAQLLWRMKRLDDARIALNRATRSMRAIPDRTAAARLTSDLTLARCAMIVERRPAEVVRLLDEAIKDLERGNRRRIARARVLQARAHIVQHDRHAAMESLRAALKEIESQRTQISTDEESLALADTSREATELLVALHFDAGDANGALVAAEQSRARLLLDAIGESEPVPNDAIPRPQRTEAFIEYFLLEDRVLLWTVTSAGMRSVAIPIDRLLLEQRVDRFHAALSAADRDVVHDAGAELFSLLLQPVWPDIRSYERLVIAADGPLYRMPFAALMTERSRHLVQDHEIANVPSLGWLAAKRRGASIEDRSPLRIVAVAPDVSKDGYPRLTWAEHDVRRIGSRFSRAVVLKGRIPPAQLASSIVDADWFHFAGHAFADERRPGRSALVASGSLLRASEIARWRLPNTHLVFLAACSTGAGRATSEGSASLARAFLLAGSRSVVATLWSVDDDDASDLTAHFYAALAKGSDPAAALRAAQCAVVHQPAKDSRYDWAAFQFIGL